MADVAEAADTETEAEAEVPAEVEAMDGIASSEEAHNADRPARASIAKKHKGGGDRSGIPLADLEIGSSVEAHRQGRPIVRCLPRHWRSDRCPPSRFPHVGRLCFQRRGTRQGRR